MICNKYSELSPIEKVKYIGELIHSVQSDDNLYLAGCEVISKAKDEGIFDGVVILPDPPNEK